MKVKPLPRGSVLVVTKTHLHEISPLRVIFSVPLPIEVEHAHIGNDPYGKVSVVAVGGNDLLFISYRRGASRFLVDPNALTTDRKGILSVYPDSKDISYAAIQFLLWMVSFPFVRSLIASSRVYTFPKSGSSPRITGLYLPVSASSW